MKKILIVLLTTFVFFSCKEDKDANKKISLDNPTLEQLNKLVEEAPNDVKVLFERAKYFYSNEKYKKAINDMKSILKIDSIKPLYYYTLADIYLDDANSRYAINTMEKVVNIHPENIKSLLKLSEVYFIVKNYDKSISTINSILYLSPDNPEAYFLLGVNFKELKQYVKAKNSFLTVVENNPENIDAWLELGQMAEQQKDKIAETYYKNALLVDKNNKEVLHHLAYYYQNNNDFQKALDIYRDIIVKNPSYSAAYLNSGIINLKQDSFKKAFDNFNLMVNLDKADPKAYYFRAVSHYMVNNDIAAKKDLEQAIKLYPEYKEAKQLLEKIQE